MFEMTKVVPEGELSGLRPSEIVPPKGKLDMITAKTELEELLGKSSSFKIVPFRSTTYLSHCLYIFSDMLSCIPIPCEDVELQQILQILISGIASKSRCGFRIEGLDHEGAAIYLKDPRTEFYQMLNAYSGDYDFVYKGVALYQMRGHYGAQGKTGPLIGNRNVKDSFSICSTLFSLCKFVESEVPINLIKFY